jgi:hypothetical protein
VSNAGFKGPFLPAADLQAKKPIELKNVNLFCVKKSLHDAVVKAHGAWKPGSRRRSLLAPVDAASGAWAAWLEDAAGA